MSPEMNKALESTIAVVEKQYGKNIYNHFLFEHFMLPL